MRNPPAPARAAGPEEQTVERNATAMSEVEISIMGDIVRVPESLTIMQAIEYAGYKLVHGVGCRGGFCGACATVFRRVGDPTLRFGLACQTVAEDGMVLAMIPFFPMHRPDYVLDKLEADGGEVLKIYPELVKCFGCNTCTKSCPQGIDVLAAVSAVLRGRLDEVTDISFDCISCGLCASRCPAELVKHNVTLLCRRLYGRNLAPKSKHLAERTKEIGSGAFDAEMSSLKAASKDDMRRKYEERVIEPS